MKKSRNAEKVRSEDHRDTYAIVGELVLISTAIDHSLNRVLMAVLNIGGPIMVEPVVATLDARLKIEMLKDRAKLIRNNEWKKGIGKYCDLAEIVFKHRNIACHTPAVLKDGAWTFVPVAAAKLFRRLDLTTKTLKHFSFDDLKAAIKTGEAALGGGENLIENFDRANAEMKRRATEAGSAVSEPADPRPKTVAKLKKKK